MLLYGTIQTIAAVVFPVRWPSKEAVIGNVACALMLSATWLSVQDPWGQLLVCVTMVLAVEGATPLLAESGKGLMMAFSGSRVRLLLLPLLGWLYVDACWGQPMPELLSGLALYGVMMLVMLSGMTTNARLLHD